MEYNVPTLYNASWRLQLYRSRRDPIDYYDTENLSIITLIMNTATYQDTA